MASNFLDRAAPLLARGFSLIPCEGKRPLTPHGALDRSKDPAVIKAWAERWPVANIAVCADGRLVLLDIDNEDAFFRRTKNGIVPTYMVRSSPGKRHCYYYSDYQLENLELGIYGSLRANNFYVVGEGSIHPKTGEPYSLISGDPVAKLDYLFLQELKEMAATAKKDLERIRYHWDGEEKVPGGMRHQFLREEGARWWKGDPEATIAKMHELDETRCDRPLAIDDPGWIERYVEEWLVAKRKEPNLTPDVEVVVGGPQPNGNVDPEDWRGLFHTYEDGLNAKPLSWAVKDFLQEEGITFFSGLAGHGKTLLMLNTVKALLEGTDLFRYSGFSTTRSQRVLYLIPESGLGPFVHRLKAFRLLEHTNHMKGGRLYYRTLSKEDMLGKNILQDVRLLRAAEGADVFLDTAVRFMTGDENSVGEHSRKFVELLFALQRVARTVSGAHHSPKAFESNESITLESALRGSGDIGAMLATAWAVRQTDRDTTRLFIKNVKSRDFEACQPFELEGRPAIDQTGAFVMTAQPGLARVSKAPKEEDGRITEARYMRTVHKYTYEQIAVHLKVSERTVMRWAQKGLLEPDKQGDTPPKAVN